MSSDETNLETTPLDQMSLFECLTSTLHVPNFQYLLQSGQSPNITDAMGVSLLYRAVLTEQFNYVQLLLEYAADPMFVYDPVIYAQYARFDPIDTSTLTSSAKSSITPSTKTSKSAKVTTNSTGLVRLLVQESQQPPLSDFEPLLFISCHFKTRKIFDAVLKSMTFEEILSVRNSFGQSIFEYVAFECSEHMVMDSLFRFLRFKLSNLNASNITTISPAIPQQYWPQELLNAPSQPATNNATSNSPQNSPTSELSTPTSIDSKPIIRFLSCYFMPHAVLHGLTSFVKLYLVNGADANGCITPYSLGALLPNPDRADLTNPVNSFLLGRHSPLLEKINTTLFSSLLAQPDPNAFQYSSALTVQYEFEPYIIVAAQCGFELILRSLLINGADVNVSSNRPNPLYGNQHLNVLSTCFFQGEFKLCRLLIFPKTPEAQKSPGPDGKPRPASPTANDTDEIIPATHRLIHTGQLDKLLTNMIKRFTDPISLTRADQFITFRYQQYLQEKREEYQQKQQQQQGGRLKGFFKGLVDATKQTISDLTTEDDAAAHQTGLQSSPLTTQNSAGLLGSQVVSPVSELIVYQNNLSHTAALTAQATLSQDAPTSTVTTILPLPHHVSSLTHLLLTKPTKEGLEDNSKNVDFIQRIYLEALFIAFCESHNVLMIKSILLLSLQYSKFINEYKKQALRFKNEKLLNKALATKKMLLIDQNIVNDETAVCEEDIVAFTSNLVHVGKDEDGDGDGDGDDDEKDKEKDTKVAAGSKSTSPGSTPTNPKTRNGSVVGDTSGNSTARRSSALQNDVQQHPGKGGLEQRNLIQMTEVDFVLPNLKLINATNPHNEYTPIHYAILHQDYDLLQFFLTFQPQLLQFNTTKLTNKDHNLGLMNFAHFLQSQLRHDLNAQLQAQYTKKLIELGLIPADGSSQPHNAQNSGANSNCAAARGSMTASTPMATSRLAGAAFRAESEKNNNNGSSSSSSIPTAGASPTPSQHNQSALLNLLQPNLELQVDWDIVDGEQDMGEDDFTVLDDDFAASTSAPQPQLSLREAFLATKKANQKQQSSISAKSLQNQSGNQDVSSKRLSDIDPHTSFDLIPDLSQINQAMGNEPARSAYFNNKLPNNNTKTATSASGSKQHQQQQQQQQQSAADDFTLVEPVVEMESDPPTTTGTPSRPIRPTRPVASATNPSSASQSTLAQPSLNTSKSQTAAAPPAQPARAPLKPLAPMQFQDSDDDDDDVFSSQPEKTVAAKGPVSQTKGAPNAVSGSLKRPFFIEIGVLLEYLNQLSILKEDKLKLNSLLLAQSNISHQASLFGTASPLQPEQTNQQSCPSGEDAQPLYLALRRLLPSSFTLGPPQLKQLEFLGAFLVNSQELNTILNKITKLAKCIDLVGYFISVLIAPLQISVDTAQSTQFLDSFVPIESSMSRFGGLGLNAKLGKMSQNKAMKTPSLANNRQHAFPTLSTFYRYKQHLSKLKHDEAGLDELSNLSFTHFRNTGSTPSSPTNASSATLSPTSSDLNDHTINSFLHSNSSSTSSDSVSPLQELPSPNIDDFQFNPDAKGGRRNSHFELMAQNIDQLKADVSSANSAASKVTAEEKLIKSQIDTLDGNTHAQESDPKRANKKSSSSGGPSSQKECSKDKNDKSTRDRDTGCRLRSHHQRRVDIVFDELLHGTGAGSTTSKKKKGKSMMMMSDDDVDGEYKFTFPEKHRLFLVQLANEQLNTEDQAIVQRFSKKASELGSLMNKLNPKGAVTESSSETPESDANQDKVYETYEQRVARLFELIGRYNETGSYPTPEDLHEIDFDDLMKSVGMAGNHSSALFEVRHKSIKEDSTVVSFASGIASTQSNSKKAKKRKITWGDQVVSK